MTTNHTANGPVSLKRLHQIREHLQHDTQYSNGGNRAYILSDVLKVIDGAIAAFGAEPVAYIFKHPSGRLFWALTDESNKGQSDVMPVYAAPPAPVSVPAAMEMDDDFDSAFEHGKAVGWNAFRAAMLRAGNHTEQHLDMVDRSGDANEKADCRLPFDQWLSQQNETIDVDCGCVTTEAFYHWLRVAYEAGNSTATPDDVLRMDWLVSKTVDVREPMVYGSHSIFWSQTITDEDDDYHATKLREQIDAAMAAEQAAAPKQEVN
ncbi:hypothetical protein ACL0YQ_000964 [Citrobacter freundii]